ncbi:MAG: hypothetical protein WA813_24305 [Beijerinckiaceae bacterium]
MSARLIPFDIELGLATELDAGVGARDVEEARAVNVTDPDVFRRCRLLCGKIGGLRPGDRDETRGGPEEKTLNELHLDLQG